MPLPSRPIKFCTVWGWDVVTRRRGSVLKGLRGPDRHEVGTSRPLPRRCDATNRQLPLEK